MPCTAIPTFEAGHVKLAHKYLAENYIQHNPMIPTGRAALVEFVSRRVKEPLPIEARVKSKLVALMAEDDLVLLSLVREYTDPKDPLQKYTTTWFDLFRVADGKRVEHWDGVRKCRFLEPSRVECALYFGGVAERFKAPVLKTGEGASPP